MKELIKTNLPTITVYRLENNQGLGPFENNLQENFIFLLAPHRDPVDMLDEIGMDKKIFEKIMNSKEYLFAWVSQEHYKNFFIKKRKFKKIDGDKECYKRGMKKSLYQTNQYILFPDGQVLFKPLANKQ